MNNVKGSKENEEDYKIDFDRIAELIEKYKDEKTQGKIKGYTEEQTKVVFITPFFKALGWNTENRQNHNDSVSYEENIAGKRSDYGFSINGITKFYLEAKSLKEEEIVFGTGYDKQAVNYAWLKSCSWAVLTNFETLAVYNADSGKAEWAFTLKSEEYLGENGKDKLKLLSKRGLEEGLLDTWASENGKKPMKRSVDKQLLQDMIHFREILSKDIKKNNPHVSEEDIDETVQRILDRLVFIRNAEDRGYESKNLKSYYNQFSQKEKGQLIKKVRELYQHYRDVYNSGLFGKESKTIHISDQVDISNEALSEVIQGLYSPEGAIYSYNFAVLDADVLGKIYEQYLGNILKQTPKRAKLEESKTHRKEQGIYYTPSYIVDYIVKNTVGEYIKTHKPEEIKNVRILDPACGSGSFLIKAYKELEGYWSKYYETNKDISKSVRTVKQTKFNPDMEGNEIEFYSTKTEILKNNIFGVDLDPRAVEIAQLNLLLQISERKHRLPLLQNNIKVGNSLIDDPSISDKAFKWESEFPEIMKEGGFDIVIGNPPYVRMQSLNKKEVEYFNKTYYSSEKNYDIYILFIERGFKQLKQRGGLGFILPHKFFEGENGTKIRQFISNSKSLNRIVNFNTNQIFEDATTYTCLLFLSKISHKKFYYKEFKLGENFRTLDTLNFEIRDVESLSAEPWNFSSEQASKILTKIRTNGISFSDITRKIFKGSSTGNDDVFLLDSLHVRENTTTVYSTYLKQEVEIENELLKQFLYGEDIRRYQVPVSHKLLLFPYYKSKGKLLLIPPGLMQSKYPKAFKYLNDVKKELLKRKVKVAENEFYKYSAGRSLSEYEQPKIMIPDMLVKNRVGYDEKGIYYHGPAIHSVLFNELVKDVDTLFYLAVLNSKIFWFFITQTSTALRGDTYRLTPEFLRPFSFPRLDLTDLKIYQAYQEVIRMVKEITLLNSKLLQIKDKRTDEYNEIENQIVRIDDEIDNKIYSFYGITGSEIDWIEYLLS